MASLYLHIPFCLSKCYYCSFCSFATTPRLYRPYMSALEKELTLLAETAEVTQLESLFIGGGTPTSLPPHLLLELLGHCFFLFNIMPAAEISIEANPGTVNRKYLELLRRAGVNRLSLGVQSFEDDELELLGRRHDSKEASCALRAAQSAGFSNINLDLMSGLPGQTSASWQRSLARGLSLHPTHLSLYQLTIEQGTPFDAMVRQGKLVLPGEEEIAQMDEVTEKLCQEGGYERYETSNYCLPGFRCRHNINYWRNGDYFAAGSSAVSCQNGIRERRVADPAEYISLIRKNRSVVMEREQLSQEESFRETVIMGLRMAEGVSREALRCRYGLDLEDYYGDVLEKLVDAGLVELTAERLRITVRGWPFSNRIMAELV